MIDNDEKVQGEKKQQKADQVKEQLREEEGQEGTEEPVVKSDPVQDLTNELKEKFNIESLREENESVIKSYVEQLDSFKQEIEESEQKAASYQKQKQ